MVPVAVEPDAAHLAVTGQQLGQLALHEVKIRIRVGGLWPSGLLSGTSARCIGAAPVYQRVVEMQRHVLTLALGGQLGYDVALERGGIHDVVISAFAVEHREAVVVTGSDADVPGSGGFDGTHPFGCVEIGGIEAPGHLAVLLVGQSVVVQGPLALAVHGVNTPVDENSETVLTELLLRLNDLG